MNIIIKVYASNSRYTISNYVCLISKVMIFDNYVPKLLRKLNSYSLVYTYTAVATCNYVSLLVHKSSYFVKSKL